MNNHHNIVCIDLWFGYSRCSLDPLWGNFHCNILNMEEHKLI